MVISDQYGKEDYAKPMHEYSEDTLREWAANITDACREDEFFDSCGVRVSERGSHIYVDYKKGGREVTLEPGMIGNELKDAADLLDALDAEWDSRERSRAYVRGEVDSAVFENKYQPEGIEETDSPVFFEKEEHEEEDRSC